jgi:hypothetical protein
MATTSDQQELDALRARVAELERERLELARRANAAIAAAQDQTYWLERWNVDLNALMRRPGAAQLRAGLRGVRWLVRRALVAARWWRG